ncbi:MAG: YjbH domain-containing protein [Thalassovita sp.]
MKNRSFSRQSHPAKKTRKFLLGSAAVLLVLPATVSSQDAFTIPDRPSVNSFGNVGLIDMPSAEVSPDAELTTSISHSAGTTRTTLSFQLLPRLSGSFRYSAINDLVLPGSTIYDGSITYYDRSFDLRYQVFDETDLRPAVSIGLRDFIGTGLYGGEYIVATKEVLPGLKVTGGLGWGRLGTYGVIGQTGSRPTNNVGQGGKPTVNQWFRGDVAPFGGIEWAATDRLSFKAEYSSDAYPLEVSSGFITRNSPWNVGLDYRFKGGSQLSVYSKSGSEIGAMFSFGSNPRYAPRPGGIDVAPTPVKVRTPAEIKDLGWTEASVTSDVRPRLKAALERESLVYEGLDLSAHAATLRLRNATYNSEPQALGRAARAMSRILPGSVESFTIVPVSKGMELAAVTFQRSDLEQLEHAPASELLKRTQIVDGRGKAPAAESGLYPKLDWSFGPFMTLSVFDPDNPVRVDLGVRLSGTYKITPNWEISGSLAKKAAGNLDSVTRSTPTTLPRVRTDYASYSRQGDPALETLTLSHFGRPGQDLYSRVTVGYLEKMYAGVSGELLWKPVDSRLALGAELNYVQQRDFDQMLGLRSYEVMTGHVSAYYSFGNGFHGQVDAGRYLAGDYGATFALDREFANGWRIGAYATLTDVPFNDFGEGSFDKGLRLSIPLDWMLGKATRKVNSVTIQSLTRDGGARVNVNNRLYGRVRDYHRPDLTNEWGRVWR